MARVNLYTAQTNRNHDLHSMVLMRIATSSLLVGLALPLVVLIFMLQMHFMTLIYIYIAIATSFSITLFLILYCVFYFHHQCPNCKKHWVYNVYCEEAVEKSEKTFLTLIIVTLSYHYESCIQELQCNQCKFHSISKVKKNFLKLEKKI